MAWYAGFVQDLPELGGLSLRPVAAKDMVHHGQRECLAVGRFDQPGEAAGLSRSCRDWQEAAASNNSPANATACSEKLMPLIIGSNSLLVLAVSRSILPNLHKRTFFALLDRHEGPQTASGRIFTATGAGSCGVGEAVWCVWKRSSSASRAGTADMFR